MSLRPYQQQAIDTIIAKYRAGVSRQLVVMATGLGKTVVAAHMPSMIKPGATRRRGMFIVNRDELCYQAARQFEKYNPHLTIGIEKANYGADDADVVIASIQTIGKGTAETSDGDTTWTYSPRLTAFNPDQFAFVASDECHHATAASYRNVFRHMRVLKGEENCDTKKLFYGLTATPNRSDLTGLEVLFDEITVNYGIRDAVKDKWLTRIDCIRVETESDISRVHTTAGDFNAGELRAVVDDPARNELIAREYLKNRREGQAFFFTVDIAHAHHLAEVLRGNGIKAYPISGKTPESECQRFMRLINEGAIDGLCSAGKLNEGVDCPRVSQVCMARPTKSHLLFQQMIGRSLRPYPSPEDLAQAQANGEHVPWIKQAALVLDFVDVSGKHSLITAASLFGLRPKFDPKGKDILEQAAEMDQLAADNPGLDLQDAVNLEDARRKADAYKTSLRKLDLLNPSIPNELRHLSRMTWVGEGEGAYRLGLMDNSMLTVRQDALGNYEISRHVRGMRTLLGAATSLAAAVKRAESEISPSDRKVLAADANWRSEPPTEKQAGRLIMIDRHFRELFKGSARALHEYCMGRYELNDFTFSRGGISDRLNRLDAARR